MNKFKAWLKSTATKVRNWFIATLAGFGLVISPMVTTAGIVNFTYTPAEFRVDGTPLALSEIQFTRLYCNDVLVAEESGADGTFDPDFTPGVYTCYATHVDTDDQESDPSGTVTKIVIPARPNPPDNLAG